MMIDRIGKMKQKEESREDAKRKLLAELEKQSIDVLTLAYMYAKGYQLSGEDVTKAWTNALQNNQLIETVYRKGYQDCEADYAKNQRRDFYHKAIVDIKK